MTINRYAARTDANQAEIVTALAAAGATIRSTASIGNGFADLAVGFRGVNYLLEIKIQEVLMIYLLEKFQIEII